MIAGDRTLLRIASSIMLVLAVFGATGYPLGAPIELVMWDLILSGSLIAAAIAFIALPAQVSTAVTSPAASLGMAQ